jgi:magnesium and cobalt transporter
VSEIVLICVPFALALATALFFAAGRSMGVITWSRLEVLSMTRARREELHRCLEERGLVITTLTVVGSLAAAALAVFLTVRLDALAVTYRLIDVALLTLGLIWIAPEIAAWRLCDELVVYVVPPLYRLVGAPFRLLRWAVQTPRGESAAPGAPVQAAPKRHAAEDAEARELFRTALRLRHVQVREIMTPRTEMVTVSETATLEQAAQATLQSGYSRLPVYRGNRDHVIGVLHAKDLLKFAGTDRWRQPGLNEFLRQPFYVPETKTVWELLGELQESNMHLGIVLDEYGGTRGVVTLEDVVEELIGDIQDEHEAPGEEPPPLHWIEKGAVADVLAVMRVPEFNEQAYTELPLCEDYQTVGGFVTYAIGRIPVKGDLCEHGTVRFEVIEADERRAVRLRAEFGRSKPVAAGG